MNMSYLYRYLVICNFLNWLFNLASVTVPQTICTACTVGILCKGKYFHLCEGILLLRLLTAIYRGTSLWNCHLYFPVFPTQSKMAASEERCLYSRATHQSSGVILFSAELTTDFSRQFEKRHPGKFQHRWGFTGSLRSTDRELLVNLGIVLSY